MPKIFVVVPRIKNDSDVIESFCRHYLRFVDGIVLTDDGSADNTVWIVESLISEGHNVILYHRSDFPHIVDSDLSSRLEYVNMVIGIAFDEHGADIVLPVNCDEFLFAKNGESPRAYIEKLQHDVVRKIKWRNAIYENEPTDNTMFLPMYFDEYLDESYDWFGRIVFSRHLYKELGGRIVIGLHDIEFPNQGGPAKATDLPELCYAHYAVRGTVQYTIKVVTGWMVMIANNITYAGEHWKNGFEDAKKHGVLSQELTKDSFKNNID